LWPWLGKKIASSAIAVGPATRTAGTLRQLVKDAGLGYWHQRDEERLDNLPKVTRSF